VVQAPDPGMGVLMDLIGAELDAAVARAQGWVQCKHGLNAGSWYSSALTEWRAGSAYSPSTEWSDGGPIIERERITIVPYEAHGEALQWTASIGPYGGLPFVGPTPLIVAMRAFVASKA
jgi:hypothetical protein